jgi:hypothetical protein
MKATTMSKLLGACAISSLALISGPGQAGGCLPAYTVPSATPYSDSLGQGARAPAANPIDARLAREMARIELGLRAGQLTPYEAGKLMRDQWEWSQFQRGFLAAGPVPPKANACAMNQDMFATMVPLVGTMAKGGMQTASSIMRALAQEVGQLIQEEEQRDALPPFDSM